MALGGQADPFLPSETMPTTTQVGNSCPVAGEKRCVVSLTPQGHPPAPPGIATRAPHYNPSVAFAMMFRWISLEPA